MMKKEQPKQSNKQGNKSADNKAALEFVTAARAFEKSEIDMVRRNSKIAWRIAGVSLLLVGLMAGAIAGLTPLKQVQPFVVRVDNATGATDIVTTVKQKEESYGEVMDKYWLTQYIQYREGYDWQTIQDSYNATMLMSAPSIQGEFAKIYNDNPAAPHKVIKDTAKVEAKINAITFIGKTAQVRFEKRIIPLTGDTSRPVQTERLIATIGFEYAGASMSEAERRVNPLCFIVTSYRVDPETTP